MIFKRKTPIDIETFYAAGGRPTAEDWAGWTDKQRAKALECQSRLTGYYLLLVRFTLSKDTDEKLAIADEMKEFDGGSLSRSIRMEINRKAMED